jgi:hypothetical protein
VSERVTENSGRIDLKLAVIAALGRNKPAPPGLLERSLSPRLDHLQLGCARGLNC